MPTPGLNATPSHGLTAIIASVNDHLKHAFIGSIPQDILCVDADEVDMEMAEALLSGTGHCVVVIEWSAENVSVLASYSAMLKRPAHDLWVLSNGDEAEHVAAYNLGADDVIVWPQISAVLKAKLHARKRKAIATRRVKRASQSYFIDRLTRTFLIHGKAVHLTVKEFELLTCLADHADRCVHRQDLLHAVWGHDFDIQTNVLDVVVYSVRSKIKEVDDRPWIKTVRGVGYRFIDPSGID